MMGASFTIAVAILGLAVHATLAADVLLAVMVAASGAEAFLAFCVGCEVFALLMRAGVIPESTCRECADLRVRRRPTPHGAR